ncbi:alpha/beta fold hydrolase [Streptomyces sp. NPDC046928]|uniref:alpha/beta fold hydrolase n=1 Tax=Streptomyces sp. NPDC046928 TaxID=3155021 RepID=UPI0033C8DFAF
MPLHTDIDVRHHRATVGGLGHHYVTAGAGPALLLLHGFPQTSREWHPLIQRLSGRFRVIAPDLRGIGGFPGPARRAPRLNKAVSAG